MLFSRSEFGTCGIEAVNLKETRSYHSQSWSIWILESLEVFFVKTNEICHTYKPQIHV